VKKFKKEGNSLTHPKHSHFYLSGFLCLHVMVFDFGSAGFVLLLREPAHAGFKSPFSCLSLLSARITGLYHHTHPVLTPARSAFPS
jgi:hypothetical protein